MTHYPAIDALCQPDHVCMIATPECEWRTVPSGETWDELHEIEDRHGKPLPVHAQDVRTLDGRFYRGDICETCMRQVNADDRADVEIAMGKGA